MDMTYDAKDYRSTYINNVTSNCLFMNEYGSIRDIEI